MRRWYRSTVRCSLVALSIAFVTRVAVALPACTAGDIVAADPGCPAQGPCTITHDIEITGACTLDFGTRSVSVGEDRTITVAPGGSLTVTAASFTMQPGAFIDGRGGGAAGGGASVTVNGTGDVILQRRETKRARIDVSDALDAGDMDIEAGGSVNLGGPLAANGPFIGSYGETIRVVAGGDLVTASGSWIEARDGRATVTLGAAGKVDLGDLVDVSGPSESGNESSINVFAGGDIIVRRLRGEGRGEFGPIGSDVYLEAGRNVQVLGRVGLRGGPGDIPEFIPPGDGGFFQVRAGGNLSIEAPIVVNGGPLNGGGGRIDIEVGGAITIAAGGAIYARSYGYTEGVGLIDMFAGSTITVAGPIDARGFAAQGGAISMYAGSDVNVRAPVDMRGEYGGYVQVVAFDFPEPGRSGSLLIAAPIYANADIELEGCDVTVARAGYLRGVAASISIAAHEQLRIDGTVSATGPRSIGDGNIQFDVRASRPPIFGSRGAVRPAPELILDGYASAPCPRCGNGVVDGSESCDDGNLVDCDGCDSNCTLSSTCGNGIRCGAEQCDAAGTAHAACCDTTCHYQPAQTACDDGELCTNGDVCNATGVCAGSPTPLPPAQCRQPAPGAAFLEMRDWSPDVADRLTWRWEKGQATTVADFGDPKQTTPYALCVYDQSGTSPLRLAADISPGGLCPTKPCWKSTDSGFRYSNRTSTAASSGVTRLTLIQGVGNQSRIALHGKGVDLGLPRLGFTPPVTVQLRNGAGACWGATYSTFLENDPLEYRARSD